jgi:uncharacterized protein (TIGR03083 family)
MTLSSARCLELLGQEGGRTLQLLADADPATPCPVCPGWTLEDLAAHLGRVYAWVATILETEPDVVPSREATPTRPEEQSAADWARERLEIVTGILRAAPADATAWSFVGGLGAPIAFWPRRLLHETAIHRVDAELSTGNAVGDLDPVAAADGIPECLELCRYQPVAWDEIDLGGAPLTVHFHITDVDGAEWTVDTGNQTYAEAHLKADVALRGPAWAIDQWCWGRVASDDPRLVLFGDRAALEEWRPVR